MVVTLHSGQGDMEFTCLPTEYWSHKESNKNGPQCHNKQDLEVAKDLNKILQHTVPIDKQHNQLSESQNGRWAATNPDRMPRRAGHCICIIKDP